MFTPTTPIIKKKKIIITITAAIITIVNSATSDLDGRAEVSEAVLTQFDEKETAQEIELN